MRCYLRPWKERGAEATLHFWKQLAKCMIFNLGNNRIATFPIHFESRRNTKHEQKRKLVGEEK
jgi:hypothetical protein